MQSKNNNEKLLSHYLGDIIYGANDGIITTFTIICGAQGAQFSNKVIVILGLINLLADGISMGASRFLSIRSKVQALIQNRSLYDASQHGLVTSLSFICFGSIPLLSYFTPGFEQNKMLITSIICLSSLFLAGSLRYFSNKEKWWQTGIEMTLVGGAAAFIAFYLGVILDKLIII